MSKPLNPALPLHDAAWRGDEVELRRFIEEGWLATKMGWGGVHLKDEHGRTALSRAAANGHANCVRYLLESGANPNAASAKGVTPLMTAAARNFFVIVVTLLEAGADADLVNESGCTALSLAQEKRCHEVVNILIAPPLHYAAKNGNLPEMERRLLAGPNLEEKNDAGETALMHACVFGKTKVVAMLLANGAELEATDILGTTALMLACANGQSEVVYLLLEEGANTWAQDARGNTALMRAAVRGSVDCAAAILEHGGSTEPENYYGKAAAQLARENGCQPVHQLIGQAWRCDEMEVPRAFAMPRIERYMPLPRNQTSQPPSPINRNAADNRARVTLINDNGDKNTISDTDLGDQEGKDNDGSVVDASNKSLGKRAWLRLTSISGSLKEALRRRLATSRAASPPLSPVFHALSHPVKLTKLLEGDSGAASVHTANSIVEDIISGVKKDDFHHDDDPIEEDNGDEHTPASMAAPGEGEDESATAAATDKTAPTGSNPGIQFSSSVPLSRTSLPTVVNLEARNTRGETPLMCACRKGYATAVTMLLEHGANFNARDFRGCSPLILAAWHGRSRCVAALTEWAILQGRSQVYSMLEAAVDLEAIDFTEENNSLAFPLRRSSRRASSNRESSATSDSGDLGGEGNVTLRGPTALHVATYRGYSHVVKLLLDAGASPDPRTFQGLAPLHFAASRGSAKMVAFLLSAGAATDSKTIRQVTPLMAAAANGRTSCVKLLLLRGASTTAEHWNGLNALNIATIHRHAAIAKLLEKASRGPDEDDDDVGSGMSAQCRRALCKTFCGCFVGGSKRLRVRKVQGKQQKFGPKKLSLAHDVQPGNEYRGVVVAALAQGCFVRFGDDEAVSPLNGLLKVRGVPAGSWLQVKVARVLPEGKIDLELVDQ